MVPIIQAVHSASLTPRVSKHWTAKSLLGEWPRRHTRQSVSCSQPAHKTSAHWVASTWTGALDVEGRGSPCRMSNLRNINVPCELVTYMAMSHVASKMLSCRQSNLRNTPCRVPHIFSHVTRLDFKECQCRHVEFRGRGPLNYVHNYAGCLRGSTQWKGHGSTSGAAVWRLGLSY